MQSAGLHSITPTGDLTCTLSLGTVFPGSGTSKSYVEGTFHMIRVAESACVLPYYPNGHPYGFTSPTRCAPPYTKWYTRELWADSCNIRVSGLSHAMIACMLCRAPACRTLTHPLPLQYSGSAKVLIQWKFCTRANGVAIPDARPGVHNTKLWTCPSTAPTTDQFTLDECAHLCLMSRWPSRCTYFARRR